MTQKIHSNFSIPAWKMPLEVLIWNLNRNMIYIAISVFAIVVALLVSYKIGYLGATSVFYVFCTILCVAFLFFTAGTLVVSYRRLKIKYLRYQKKKYENFYAEVLGKSGSGNHPYEHCFKSRFEFFSDQLRIELKRGRQKKIKGVPNHPILKKKEQEEFVTGV